MDCSEHFEILLVEDSDADAEMTLRALRRNNFTAAVHRAKDGPEALELLFPQGDAGTARRPAPKLVLLDIKMPKLSGIEVLRRLKEDPGTRSIPVVMLTSSDQEPDIAESYRLGANSYIVKPVTFEGFLDVVTKIGLYWAQLNKVPHRAA